MRHYVICTFVLLLTTGILADPINKETTAEAPSVASGFSKCLEMDSISCLQLTLFRKAKSIFENPHIEIVGGVSLVKSNEGRQGKSLEDNAIAVEGAPTIEARTTEMGTYFMNHAKNFFVERSLNFNFANAARSMARAIPDDIKADLRELVVESRTKKKKLLKKFLPILLGVGAKIALLGVGAIIGLFFLAKKALIVAILAFIMALAAGASSKLSGLASLGKSGASLLGGLGSLGGGVASGLGSLGGGLAGGLGGLTSGLGSLGNKGSSDSYGSYSSPVGQSIAYSGYNQARR